MSDNKDIVISAPSVTLIDTLIIPQIASDVRIKSSHSSLFNVNDDNDLIYLSEFLRWKYTDNRIVMQPRDSRGRRIK